MIFYDRWAQYKGRLTNIRANDITDVFEVSVDWILYVDEEKKKIQSIKKWLTGYEITQNIEKKFGKKLIWRLNDMKGMRNDV